MYESEFTLFLRELHQKNPHLADEQRKGWALWWDRPQDPDAQRAFKESRVPQAAYVYQTNSRP